MTVTPKLDVTDIVVSRDAELAVRVDGADHLPWIVLSNSLAADLTMWDDQIPFLTRSYRVLRYDTRGHGRSSAPNGPYSFDMLVADFIAVMDRFDVRQADVLGLSMGGMTALGVGLAYPERVNRLICADARADAPPPFVAGWDQRIAAVAAGGMGAVLAGTMERWFTAQTRQERPEIVDRAARMVLDTSPVGYAGCAEALKGLDYLRHLPRLEPETLYIVGAEDGGAPPDAMRAMAAATPGAQFEILPRVAHISNMEDVAGFNARVAEFLDISRQAAE
ncbi:alpha/beta hydrolase fold protein [Ancylobacter novellus DSM 506]|uniref:Alpha/beta hydrolase fold protein n=1 Tax=Ancylobacter novellus (strain ATCC 8093 / DSM 506 / JCM 20403 / CCM 1077 / IAM 12100 / NBRC 12443 / NCIMB 10456) TaxID=639283 RepID=D7A1U7_ANCN5|nr:alpha/beta fold hydrolase [Ancylobacter novellus]ADH87563.1 alpha/beta hydrolase fold protein [Ancylobacter novellus DSM 506]